MLLHFIQKTEQGARMIDLYSSKVKFYNKCCNFVGNFKIPELVPNVNFNLRMMSLIKYILIEKIKKNEVNYTEEEIAIIMRPRIVELMFFVSYTLDSIKFTIKNEDFDFTDKEITNIELTDLPTDL
jgi:hypothetical protein